MTSRSRFSKSHDWDPMQEDYNDRSYNPQYLDDDVNANVQLDHCKLYVKNISKALNEDGLKAVFEKYATNVKVFLSNNPLKRFAIVSFDSPGEAKLAMMKLNRAEPLKLIISIAHMSKNQDSQNRTQNSRPTSQRQRSESGSSRGWSFRKQEEQIEDDDGLDESLDDGDLDVEGFDTESELEQVNLKLKYLELKAEQIKCKQRIILLNKAGKKTTHKPSNNRCILPDGRIVVKNDSDRPSDNAFSSAGGDSSLPALQRHACTWCSAPADSYCSRCGVTPYCSQRCQMLDWQKRHRAVCHNLSGDQVQGLRGKDQPVVLPIKAHESRVKESQVINPIPIACEVSSQSVKRENIRDNSVNSNDRPNKYQQQQSVPKVNRNQQFKGYNNLRRPKVVNDNKTQDGEESFDNNVTETKLQEFTQKPEPKPKPQLQPEQEPMQPKNQQQKPENLLRMVSKIPSAETTPTKGMCPKNYLVETLPVGETLVLTVSDRAQGGVPCISLHARAAALYDALCEQFGLDCEQEEPYVPQLGELFAYLNTEDSAWYRARRLSPTCAMLIDVARLTTIRSRCCRCPAAYGDTPEFSCLLMADGIEIGDNLKCTIKSKSVDKCIVSIENLDTGSNLNDGEISRWTPKVESADVSAIPTVNRPDVKHNTKMYLVDCTTLEKVFLRPSGDDACREFDAIQEDILLYAKNAEPIKENPTKGQTVIARFTDGLWYRALCKRTSHSQNKYQLEYMEYGNIETQSKEDIYECPPSLLARPTPVVCAKLKEPATSSNMAIFNAATMPSGALSYLQNLRDRNVELILTLPDGSSSSPSGSEVNLRIAKTKESVNEKVLELCTPEWKKLEQRGGDVVELPRLTLADIRYVSLPSGACELDVFVDLAALCSGSVSARPRGRGLEGRLEELTGRMAQYCQSDLGKETYLPAHEELCIAQCPPYTQWFRAVLCEQVGGPGGSQVRLCYIDYGNLETVDVKSVRKMLPEFIELPALSLHVNIRGFPQNATNDMLAKAVAFMEPDEEGRGVLKVMNCKEIGFGMYDADAPGLVDALK